MAHLYRIAIVHTIGARPNNTSTNIDIKITANVSLLVSSSTGLFLSIHISFFFTFIAEINLQALIFYSQFFVDDMIIYKK